MKNNVQYVPKSHNPPNCPQFRPIERYWGIVKRNLRMTGAVATSTKSMALRWNAAARKVKPRTVQNMMGGIKRRVRRYLREKE